MLGWLSACGAHRHHVCSATSDTGDASQCSRGEWRPFVALGLVSVTSYRAMVAVGAGGRGVLCLTWSWLEVGGCACMTGGACAYHLLVVAGSLPSTTSAVPLLADEGFILTLGCGHGRYGTGVVNQHSCSASDTKHILFSYWSCLTSAIVFDISNMNGEW